MADVARLTATIEVTGADKAAADLRKVDAAGDQTARNLEKSAGGIGSAFGGIAKNAAGIAAGLGAFELAKGAISGVKSALFDFNAGMEQARIGFTTMLGSGEAANAFLKDLQRFAATTPFEFPELRDNAQKMLAMGVSADQVIPRMTAIGDAVAALGGGGELVGRITTALGQMGAKGKVSAEEMLQLTEAGIPAWDMLAKAIGVSVPEAMKLAEKGAITADTAIGAITSGMTERFGGMMAAQSKTFSGAMSTIKDSVNQAMGTAFAPLFDMVSKGAVQMAAFLSTEKFAAFAESVASGIGSAIETIAGFAQAAGPALLDLWQRAAPAVQSFVTTVMDGIGGAVSFIQSNWSQISGILTEVWGTVKAVAGAEIAAVQAVVSAFIEYIQTRWPAIRDALTSAWADIQPAVERAMSAARTALESVVSFVQERWPQIRQTAETILDSIGQAFNGILQEVGPTLDAIVSHVERVVQEIGERWGQIEPIVTPIINLVVDVITNGLNVISNAVQTVMNVIQGDWSGAWQNIQNIGSSAWAVIESIVSNGTAAVQALLQLGWEVLKDIATAAWDGVKTAVGAAWDEIRTAVTTGIGEIEGLMRALPGQIVAALGNLANLLYQAGKDLVSGMVRGIRDSIGDVLGAVGELGQAALDKINVFGRSPWPGTIAAGQDYTAGFALGIEQGTPAVIAAVTAMGEAALETAEDYLKRITAVFQSAANVVATSAGGVVTMRGGGGGGAFADFASFSNDSNFGAVAAATAAAYMNSGIVYIQGLGWVKPVRETDGSITYEKAPSPLASGGFVAQSTDGTIARIAEWGTGGEWVLRNDQLAAVIRQALAIRDGPTAQPAGADRIGPLLDRIARATGMASAASGGITTRTGIVQVHPQEALIPLDRLPALMPPAPPADDRPARDRGATAAAALARLQQNAPRQGGVNDMNIYLDGQVVGRVLSNQVAYQLGLSAALGNSLPG